MNCNQANKISIKTVLESFSLSPSKENSKTAFYFALDREEKSPSLSVDFIKNTAFDFGTGKSYDCISIVQIIKKCSVSEALKYLEKFNYSFQKQVSEIIPNEKKYEIMIIKKLTHPALLEYLKFRKLDNQNEFLKEIHYLINDRNYFGIGFKNNSGGYEIRNKYSKICLGKKDCTSIKIKSKTVRIFEGFFDFLSFKNLENFLQKKPSDYIILNSVSMINRIKKELEIYENIELYLDNDHSGDQATAEICAISVANDCRTFYKNCKDINEFLVSNTHV